MIVGRTITTFMFPFVLPTIISPIAFVKTYVFGHPYLVALIMLDSKILQDITYILEYTWN